MCIELICLFLKQYLNGKEFEYFFFTYNSDFEDILPSGMFYELLEADYNSKNDLLSIRSHLMSYITFNYNETFNNINDAYIDKLLESKKSSEVISFINKRYEKKSIVCINCKYIKSKNEFIMQVKSKLNYPLSCGNNWDAINDFIYDIILPQIVQLKNWDNIEKYLPDDARTFKKIFSKVTPERCKFEFV